MKKYGGWRYSSTILELGTRQRRVITFTLQQLNFRERATDTYWIGG
jgi:hypothetical protein